jgi:hypothetical protein
MAYQKAHLQHTIAYIVEQAYFDNNNQKYRSLTENNKKHLKLWLEQALDPIQKKNPKNIVIKADNGKLENFFRILEEEKISLANDKYYIMKREGISYECSDREQKEIYNRQKIKEKGYNKKYKDKELNSHHSEDESKSNFWGDQSRVYTPHKDLLSTKYIPIKQPNENYNSNLKFSKSF